jgi:hypothetical protein
LVASDNPNNVDSNMQVGARVRLVNGVGVSTTSAYSGVPIGVEARARVRVSGSLFG